MARQGLGCLGIAALFTAGMLGFFAWVLSTDYGNFALEELKSRNFERSLRSGKVDHPALRTACLPLLGGVGTNAFLVLKDHNTPTDPRIPQAIRELEPDRIRVSTNQVDLAWNTQLGACGLVYYSTGTDLDREIAAIRQGFSDASRTEQTVIQVADHVLFYSYRLNILGF